jgi:hypothetical protein
MLSLPRNTLEFSSTPHPRRVDGFNLVIEAIDPGERGIARLN